MANNCLVTKLKSVVNNDNLLEFGHFRVNYIFNEGDIVSIKFGTIYDDSPFTVKSINNQSIYEANVVSYATGNNIPAGTIIDVSNKYKITTIIFESGGVENGEQFSYFSSLKQLRIRNASLKNCNIYNVVNYADLLNEFYIDNSELQGDISVLNDHISQDMDAFIIRWNSGLYGSLDTILSRLPINCNVNINGYNLRVSRSAVNAAIARGLDCSNIDPNLIIDD